MAEPISIQQLKNASEDAISLAEFIYKPASAMVKRRLAPDMHTLDFYTNLMENLVIGKVRAQDVSTSDGSTQEVKNTKFRNELDALPFEGGVLADTYVTMTAINPDGVARTLRDVRSDRVSIKDFGALGLGDASLEEDSAAFLAAWNYCKAKGAGTIFVPKPPVAYSIKALDLRDGVDINIVGESSKIWSGKPTSSPWAPLHFTNCSYISITGLEVDGRYSSKYKDYPASNRINNGNMVFINCQNIEIFNNTLKDSGYNTGLFDVFGDGIYVGGMDSRDVNIHHNLFINDGRWAFALTNGIKNFYFNDNKVIRDGEYNTALGGVDLEIGASGSNARAVYNVEVCRNNMKGNVGIVSTQNLTRGYVNIKVCDNVLDNTFVNGVQPTGLYSFGISVSKGFKVTITGNTVLNPYKDSLSADNSEDVFVANNSVLVDADSEFNNTSVYLFRSNKNLIFQNNVSKLILGKAAHIDIRGSYGYCIVKDNLSVYSSDKENNISISMNASVPNPKNNSLVVLNNIIDCTNCEYVNNAVFTIGGILSQNYENYSDMRSVIKGNTVLGDLSKFSGRLSLTANNSEISNNSWRVNEINNSSWREEVYSKDISREYSIQESFLGNLPKKGFYRMHDKIYLPSLEDGLPRTYVCTKTGFAYEKNLAVDSSNIIANNYYLNGGNVYKSLSDTSSSSLTVLPTHIVKDEPKLVGGVMWLYLGKPASFEKTVKSQIPAINTVTADTLVSSFNTLLDELKEKGYMK